MFAIAALAGAALADLPSSSSPVGNTVAVNNDIFLCVVPAFSNRPDIRLEDPTKKCGGGIGYIPQRFRHDPKELERRLAKYGEEERRKRLDELITEATRAALDTKNKAKRKAIKAAVAKAELVQEVDLSLLIAMEEISRLQRAHDQVKAANHAAMIARARYEYEMEQDEEEAIMLLLN